MLRAPDPAAPFATRSVLLILAGTIAVGICAFMIVTYSSGRSTCACSGDAKAVDLVQHVVAQAGGVEAWQSIGGIAWTAPDGSKLVYGRRNDVGQVQVGQIHLGRRGDEWGVYDYNERDWPLQGALREQRGSELLPLYYRDYLVACLPFVLCDPTSVVHVVEETEAGTTLRLSGRIVTLAGLDTCDVVVNPRTDRIVSSKLIGAMPAEFKFSRWERAVGIDVPVVEGFDDEKHRVEVLDHHPWEKFILGRM